MPRALYVDRAGIYRSDGEPTPAEILANIKPCTQFGRAMQELDVELILARSPQASCVERMNGTLQDRLVKALRQVQVSDLAAANTFLEDKFLGPFNAISGTSLTAVVPLRMRKNAGQNIGMRIATRMLLPT